MELSKFHLGKKQAIILGLLALATAGASAVVVYVRNKKAKNGTNEEVPADPQN